MNIRDFQNRFSSSDYRHKALIEDGIEKGILALESAAASDQKGKHYLDIYEFRQKVLMEKEPKTEHILSLTEDVEQFCSNLSSALEKNIDLWIFSGKEMWTFTVFASHNSNKVLGCIKGADDRKISNTEYFKLWGKERKA